MLPDIRPAPSVAIVVSSMPLAVRPVYSNVWKLQVQIFRQPLLLMANCSRRPIMMSAGVCACPMQESVIRLRLIPFEWESTGPHTYKLLAFEQLFRLLTDLASTPKGHCII